MEFDSSPPTTSATSRSAVRVSAMRRFRTGASAACECPIPWLCAPPCWCPRTGVVVSCIRARSAARHNSAGAPQRVLRWRRVRSCPLPADASRGNDAKWRPSRALRRSGLIKYLPHPLREPAWASRSPASDSAGSPSRPSATCSRTVRIPAVRDGACRCASPSARPGAASSSRTCTSCSASWPPSRRAQPSGSARPLARAAASLLRLDHHAVHLFPQQSAQVILRAARAGKGGIRGSRPFAGRAPTSRRAERRKAA